MPKGYIGPPIPGRNLAPLSPTTLPPPPIGYRIIPGSIWTSTLVHRWYEHYAQAMIGLHYALPTLAADKVTRVYFTDRDSIQSLSEPAQFPARLSLSRADHDLCQRYGVLIVAFTIPDPTRVVIPRPKRGTVAGSTHRGGREWVYRGNIPFSANMDIWYIHPEPDQTFYFEIPLKYAP